MAKQSVIPGKFRPERPIYLNEQNTGFKTKVEVLHAIEQLRDNYAFLVCYGEKSRPFHMSFNDEKEFQEFKKACKELSITLKTPTIMIEEIEELEVAEQETNIKEETTSSYEDSKGKIHIE